MDIQKLLELLLYSLPAIITGVIAFLFFKKHTDNEEGRRRFILHKEAQSAALPLRLQAYERMALFLERINPTNLMTRINPVSSDKRGYAKILIANIEQEFEHNLAQQIYISEDCWNVIKSAKNATITSIRNISEQEVTVDANNLRELVLTSLLQKSSPSDTGMSFIKNEISDLFN